VKVLQSHRPLPVRLGHSNTSPLIQITLPIPGARAMDSMAVTSGYDVVLEILGSVEGPVETEVDDLYN
jgi:hypothetical protein